MKRVVIAGVLLALIGLISFYAIGPELSIGQGTLAMTSEGEVGVNLDSNLDRKTLLTQVSPGETYEWKVTYSNTGSVDWDRAFYNVRVEKTGTNANIVTLGPSEADQDYGDLKVFSCDYGTDVASCRSNPTSNWKLQYEANGNWYIPGTSEDLATIPAIEALRAGESDSVKFRLTVPEGASGDVRIIGNLEATVHKLHVLDNNVETLNLKGGGEEANVVEESSSVKATVDGKIVGDFKLKNTGGTTAKDFLVEMVPRQGGCTNYQMSSVLGMVSEQDVCDSDHPENVHRYVRDLKPGESVSFSLETVKMPPGTYCALKKSFASCCVSGGCEPRDPYNWKKVLGEVTITGCEDGCTKSRCQRREWVECKDSDGDGCKEEDNQGKVVGKCGIECKKAADCYGENQICEDYMCVTEEYCGDGICESSESMSTCPKDCGKDSDGDGVKDSKDQCPGTPKKVEVDDTGCAIDSDGDGVPNYKDDCPYVTGSEANNGCPVNDQDRDGVIDARDKCLGTWGSKTSGCPTVLDRIVNFFVSIGLYSR